jgi:hypothetical protein
MAFKNPFTCRHGYHIRNQITRTRDIDARHIQCHFTYLLAFRMGPMDSNALVATLLSPDRLKSLFRARNAYPIRVLAFGPVERLCIRDQTVIYQSKAGTSTAGLDFRQSHGTSYMLFFSSFTCYLGRIMFSGTYSLLR